MKKIWLRPASRQTTPRLSAAAAGSAAAELSGISCNRSRRHACYFQPFFRCLPQNSATPAFAAFSPDPSYPEGFFLILVENSVVEWILVFASIPVKVYATLVLAHHAQR